MSLKIFSKNYDGSFLDASTENGILTTYHNLVTYQTKNNTIFLQADDNEEYNLIELSLKGKEYYLQYPIDNIQTYIDFTYTNGLASGSVLMIDEEQVLINSINHATRRAIITRGFSSTVPSKHNSSAKAEIKTSYTNLYSIDSDGNLIKTYNGTITNLIDPIILQEDIDDEQTSFLVSDTFDCLIGAKFTDGIENFIVKDKVKGDQFYLLTVERENPIPHTKGEIFYLAAIKDQKQHKLYYSTTPIKGSIEGTREDIVLTLDYDSKGESFSDNYKLRTIIQLATVGTIGDSITAGHAAFRAEDHKGTFCRNGISYNNDNTSEDVTSQYQYWLSYRLGKNYNVYNYGTGEEVGYQVKNRFTKEILALHPDYAIIQCGTNDLSLFNGATVISGIALDATMDQWIFSETPIVFEKNGATITYYGLIPAVKEMVELSLENGVVPIIGNLLPRNGLSSDMRKAFDAYNEWLKNFVASKENVYMIDFFNAQENGEYLREDPNDPTNYRMNDKYSSGVEFDSTGAIIKTGDGIHLNSNGYRIMGYYMNIDILFDASVEGFYLYTKPDTSLEPIEGILDTLTNRLVYTVPFNLVQIGHNKIATRYLYNKGTNTELYYISAKGNGIILLDKDKEVKELKGSLAPGNFFEIKFKISPLANTPIGRIQIMGRPLETL